MAKQYEALAYRQSPDEHSPWVVTFVAPAEELLTWAGIPRRADRDVVGFQRPFDPARLRQVQSFFSLDAKNLSPTALVVGIHADGPAGSSDVRLEFLDATGDVRRAKLLVDYDDSELSLQDVVERVKRNILRRLGESNLPATDESADSDEGVDSEVPEDPPEEAAEDSASNAGGEVSDDEVELGRSLLTRLLKRLDDSEWCATNVDELKDLARPATVIDGQHRVKGAELCERRIPFAVCAIFDCPWEEQVYQFTVLNYTAKGIPDQFITANAALSLTREELGRLRDRLVQAGVRVVEYELMRVVNFDSKSPFYNMINLSEKKDPDRIGYKTMVQVAKAWYDPKHPSIQRIIASIYPGIKGKAAKAARRSRWREDDWGLFFLDFWNAVHDQFAETPSHQPEFTLWDGGHSNLLVAVVLHEFQEAFFANLDQQDETYFQVPDGADPRAWLSAQVKKRAAKFVTWFPAEFWQTKWGWKSLSIGPGREALRKAFGEFVAKQGAYQYGKSTLVTGKTS